MRPFLICFIALAFGFLAASAFAQDPITYYNPEKVTIWPAAEKASTNTATQKGVVDVDVSTPDSPSDRRADRRARRLERRAGPAVSLGVRGRRGFRLNVNVGRRRFCGVSCQ